jgi:hypothetical protein
MHISRNSPVCNSATEVQQNRAQVERYAGFYASRLAALRSEAFGLRCQLDNPHNDSRRALLATRLDVVDARAADIAALLIGVAA